MHKPLDQHKDDWTQVQQYLSGETRILEDLIEKCGPAVRKNLIRRGATPAEAEELTANLWSDCVPDPDNQAGLLEKYTGQTALQSWLLTVATRRLIDFKRRQRFTVSADHPAQEETVYQLQERAAAPPDAAREDSLLELLHRSLRQALDRAAPQDLLMLRLVHLHGLTQREICRMWGWHETKVSRCLNQTMRFIQQETLRQTKQSDPWLQLTWQDFLDLCETRLRGFL